jgi:hypothetical protein
VSQEGDAKPTQPEEIELGAIDGSESFEVEHTRVATAPEKESARAPSPAPEPSLELPVEPAVPAAPAAAVSTAPAAAGEDGGTRVDLGDDLLERTAMLPMPGAVVEPSAPRGGELVPDGPVSLGQIEDLLESARILAGEGLLEDAKKVLRKILLADPGRLTARQMLEEIHETELKQIFGESELPRRRLGGRDEAAALEATAEAVLRGLDRDLKLGMLDERPSLFRDDAAMDAFGARMDREHASLPPSERMDLGIAFLEMGLPALAARHFKAAESALSLGREAEATAELLVATGLLAYAYICDGRGFEASLALQPLLNDVEIARERKVDLMYMMGRAFELLDKPATARSWYAQAAEIEPHYRDVDDRLRATAPGAPRR